MTPKLQKTVSAIVALIGVVLMTMMIVVEDEPGALPLALVLLGVLGYLGGGWRARAARRR